eukprot:TRINITY_DN22698_c0_g1_i1.p1 TRINITY_DN22698_c0_g1~~TRINITY_DN22698_c0_g1_i1.p1  ORF type:complete len:123 (+),score=15.16 TRINITY_DN22698_c0_g1_i1:190-558(+)
MLQRVVGNKDAGDLKCLFSLRSFPHNHCPSLPQLLQVHLHHHPDHHHFLQSIAAIDFISFSCSLQLRNHNGKGTLQLAFIFPPSKESSLIFLLRVFSYVRYEHHERQKMFLQEAVVAGFDPG